MTSTETTVRRMTKAQRVAYLRDHGWHRLSAAGSQNWFAPGWTRDSYGVVEPPEHDRCFYSLAAAIREAVNQANP